MIKEILFERKFIRFFGKLALLRTFGDNTRIDKYMGNWQSIRITKPWQLDMLEEFNSSFTRDRFDMFGIKWPKDSDEWVDLRMILSLITRNKTMELADGVIIHDAVLYFGPFGFEVRAYDVRNEHVEIGMGSFDRFRKRKCGSDKDTTTYKLTMKEQERQWLFNDIHCFCDGHTETIFTPNNIGVCTRMRCPGCGEEVDITDVDCW